MPNFIINIIEDDLKTGKHKKIITRFPPEPNGYLHIGHAKSIHLNFNIAKDYKGICHLRFDDTNPEKEDQEYIDSIKKDIKYLGYNWDGYEFYASDYFEKLYNYAVNLIKAGKAFVCKLSAEEMREYRGTLTNAGKESPYRNQSIEENLNLFEKMKNGEIEEGKAVLRAKIDMSAANLNMRDPVLYRIRKIEHQRTGSKWVIYPMYDFAHSLSDAIEGITHSLCTLEFEDHRPLYDWCVNNVEIPFNKPRQIEFARLNITYTVLSKRKLLYLVENGFVNSWDDPRMPTISAMRKRGYPSKAILDFCDTVGIGKQDTRIDLDILEESVRTQLKETAPRILAVKNPIKLKIINADENFYDELDAPYMPNNPDSKTRKLPFTNELYIERKDFMENAPKHFYRLSVGREVRLRYAYFVKCVDFVKDKDGNVTEILCTYDPETRGGNAQDGRKVKATIHWVDAKHSKKLSLDIYDRLFTVENPDTAEKLEDVFNKNSLVINNNAYIEQSADNLERGKAYQFERLGYFLKQENKNNNIHFSTIVEMRNRYKAKQKK